MTDEIPADVRQFILANIDSVPQLEALLLVWERRDVWTEDRLRDALYVQPGLVRVIAAQMLRHGWIRSTPDSAGFEFDSAWDPDDAFMNRLAMAYRSKLVRVTTLIHSNASAGMRDFAKAFEFKKD